MFYKNVLVITLLMHTFSAYATSATQENQVTHTVQVTVTSTSGKASEDKQMVAQETPTVRTYASPSVETLQADKEFCLRTLSDDTSDINAPSPSGKTTLQLLTLYFINNFNTEQLIAQALKRGANANVRDGFERSPLFFVTAYALCPEIFAEKQAALDDSLTQETRNKKEAGVTTEKDLSVENTDEKATRNPLHNRALTLAVVELLLAFSADPTITDKDGISPLLLAVSTGDQEVVELFARYGMLERIFQAEDMVETTDADQTKTVTAESTN